MKIFKSIKKWQNFRKAFTPSQSLGFVPTMGALHKGHLSLIKKSRKENNLTLVSIFLNPTQFNSRKDLKKYPNDFEEDIKKLKSAKVDFLLFPDYKSLYPDNYIYKIVENKITNILCGRFRPGHFEGVLTVVMKLLNIAKAEKAYFGEKDFQQYLLIKNMIKAFFLNTKIILCPTVRNKNGLALSSRNKLLSKNQKNKAILLNKFLKKERKIQIIRKKLRDLSFKVEYIERHWGRKFAAVKLGNVRLIDNVKT